MAQTNRTLNQGILPTLKTTTQYTDHILSQLALGCSTPNVRPISTQTGSGALWAVKVVDVARESAELARDAEFIFGATALSVMLEVARDRVAGTFGAWLKKLMRGTGGESEKGRGFGWAYYLSCEREKLGFESIMTERVLGVVLDSRNDYSSDPNDHLDIAYHNMPSDWYKRQKDKFKRALAPNSSSASLPNSNAPPLVSPVSQVVVNEGLGDTLGILLPGQAAPPAVSPVGALSIKSPPNYNPDAGPMDVLESHEPTVTDTNPPPDDIPNTKVKTQGMAWSGLKSLGGVIKTGGAFGPLESALEGLERCADIFEGASKARDDYLELRKKLDQLLGDLAQFNHAWMNKAMTASVKNLCSGIEAEIKLIEEKQGKQVLGRYMGAMEDSEAIIGCYRRINGHVERLLLNANLNLWKTFDEEMTDRRLLQMSPTMSGAYDSWAADRTKRRGCANETRESELEKLKTWARDPSAEPVYWINGMAGTGKTTIAYTLCDELDKTDELAASFFCTRLLPECRDIRLIIPSIAYQLSRFSYPFRHALSRVFESDQMAHTRGLERQFQMLIDTPIQAVKQTLPPGTVVIIDALDECEDRDNIEKLLELLVASTANSPIRFLVSSRPEPEIYRRMMQQVGGTPDAKLVLHELDPFDVQHDIEKYLRQELQDLPLTVDQWDGLLRRCGTLFIYASTACRFIKSGDEMMSFEEAMDMVLGLSTGTGGTEKELDKLYTAILDSAFNRPRISDENKKRMKAVLDTVICAQEPMSTETLAGLLELKNAEHARTLLRPLLSVVNVTEDTGLATTLHASFPDFMLSADRSAGFYCAATQHHITLTLACLKRIRSNPVQFNIYGIESSYLLKAEIEDLNEQEHAISSALFYACCHWHNHLELADHSSEIREPLFDFLSARLLFWLEAMHSKSDTLNQLPSFKKVEKWCREACMPKDLVELAQDAWEFITYQHMERGRVTDIYISHLLFWPSASPISLYYAPRTTGMPQLQGPAMTHPELPHLASWYIGNPMQTVCYCSDGTRVVAAVGNNIHIVDEWTGQTILGPLEGHTDLVTCVAASPNGSYIVSGAYDATIQIWDAKDGKLVTERIKAHRDRVTSVAFSPDSTRIVSTGAFAPLCVWSVPYGEHIVSSSVETESLDCVRTAVFSADGSFIISGDDNGSIAYWDAYTGNLISRQSSQHSARINSVAISSDGLRFVSASEDANIYAWDTKTQRTILGPLGGDRNSKKAMFSPNDQYIASYGDPDEIFLWDAGTGRSAAVIYRGPQVRKQVKSISFSPDSSRLSSCADDGTISIWDIQSATRTTDLAKRVLHGIHSACFTLDGSQIVTGGRTGSVCLWDTQNGQLVMGPLTGHNGYICSVAISSDGKYIASASSDKTIRLWDVKCAKGTCKVIEQHTKRADLLKFTADGSRLLYGSVVYLIGDSPFSSEIAPTSRSNARDEWAAEVFTNNVCCNASSPDGLFAASGSADGTVQVWNSKTGQLILGPIWAHTRAISRILFSPDGTHIASCSLDNTMRFWPIPGKSKREGLGSDSADNNKGTGTSPIPDLHWKLDDEGWVINDSNQVLLRVPRRLVPYLLLPENDRLISHRGWFSLDFTGANIGELWTRCYHPLS